MTLPTSPTIAPSTVLCGYCLGSFVPGRSDAEWCGGACRMAVSRALEHESHADVPMAHERRRTSGSNATGFYLSPEEAVAADLRVRCLAGEQVETLAQWRAVDAMPGARERVVSRDRLGVPTIGHDAEAWAALRVVLEARRAELAEWLARH